MASKAKAQRGGFFLGMIIGLLVGVMIALGVALYVTKVPIPFVDKVPQRTQQQEADEAERNKRWDPNAPLGNKPPARGVEPGAASAPAPTPAPVLPPPVSPAPANTPPTEAPAPKAAASRPAAAASAAPASSGAQAEALQFYVQVGAYARSEDAEQQRAKLAMSGMVGRITEREQAGRLMYRVRLGPFDSHDEATQVKQQAATAGYPDAALVRVPRNP